MPPSPRRALGTESGRLGDTFRFIRIGGQVDVTDPFLSIDQYEMSGPTFPPHPHAGFAAVTYIFDSAETGVDNRDSAGDQSHIAPGDLHWTVAGSGMIHEEVPREPGKVARGLQIFVNLPEAMHARPGYSVHQHAADRPVVERDGVRRTVVFGADGGLRAPIEIPVDVSLVELQLESGAEHELFPRPDRTTFFLVSTGSVDVGDKTFRAGTALLIDDDSTLIAKDRSHVFVFEGAPLRQPVVFVGPVAMTTEEKAQRVMNRYRQGLLGRL